MAIPGDVTPPRTGDLVQRVAFHSTFWLTFHALTFGLSFRASGRGNIPATGPVLLVSNHQSFLDVLVLFRLFTHFQWVSKAEMFRIPCLGWNMALNDYVRLRRGSPESIARMMATCERHLAMGSSIMIFPEGTRSPDGRLRAFKHGAFTLAQRAGVPILPIVVDGTAHALPKHGFILGRRHAIRVAVLDEIPAAEVIATPPEALVANVRARIARELGQTLDEDPAAR